MSKKIVLKSIVIMLAACGVLLSHNNGFTENEKGKAVMNPAVPAKEIKIPDVVATVNGTNISGAEFSKTFQSFKKRLTTMGQQFPEERAKDINKSLIEDMISRELLMQNSKKKGIKISDDELKKEIDTIKSRFPSEDHFNQMIKSQNMTMDDIKTDVRKGITIKKLIKNDIEDKVSVDEKTVEDYYKNNSAQFLEQESVKASHILVKADKNATKEAKEAAKKKIDGLLKKVKGGEDFAKLAKENSDDPGSGQNGGDLGFFGKGMMVPPFEKAAFSLNKVEVSDVVETEFGYHIIKMVDKKPGRTIPLNEVHDKLKDYLKSMEVNKKLSEYITNLRKTAVVKVVEF